MEYKIEKKETFFEINVSGEVSIFDILAIVEKLAGKDPGKHYPDLWIIAQEVEIPYSQFRSVAKSIEKLFVTPPISDKTAIVAADYFQKAQLDMYRQEASNLPLDIQIFTSRDNAIAWINNTKNSNT